jgi:integrase/recombinase XerC
MDTDKAMTIYTTLHFLPEDVFPGKVSNSSLKMYTRDFEAYATYAIQAGLALNDPTTLARWSVYLVKKTTMSPRTINRMLSAVKSLMLNAAEMGYIAHDVADAFKHVRGVKVVALKDRTQTHARTRIEKNNMRGIIESIDTATLVGLRNKALYLTLATAGLRISEATSLTKQQIQRRGSRYVLVVMGKNDEKPRDTQLSPEAHAAILAWLNARRVESDYVFTAFGGRSKKDGDNTRERATPISEQKAWEVIKEIAEAYGIDNVKPHDLRRYAGTAIAKKDLRQAQKSLGHKRISTTVDNYVLDDLELGLTDDII